MHRSHEIKPDQTNKQPYNDQAPIPVKFVDSIQLLDAASHRKCSIEYIDSKPLAHGQKHDVTNEKSTDILAMRKALTRVKQTLDSNRSPQSIKFTQSITQSSHNAAKLRLQHVYELSQTQPNIEINTFNKNHIHHTKTISDPSAAHRLATPVSIDLPKPRLRPRAISTGNGAVCNPVVDMIAPYTSTTSSCASTPLRCTPPRLNRFLSHHIPSTNTSATSSPSRSLRTLKQRMKSRTNTPKLQNDDDQPFSPLSAPATIRARCNSVSDKSLTPVIGSMISPMTTVTPTHQLNSIRRHTVPSMRSNNSLNASNDQQVYMMRTPLSIHTPLSINNSCRSSSEIAFSNNSNALTPSDVRYTYNSRSSSPLPNQADSIIMPAYSLSSTPIASVYPTPKHIQQVELPMDDIEQSQLINNHKTAPLQIDTIASLIHHEPVTDYRSPVHGVNPFGLKLQLNNDDSAPHSFLNELQQTPHSDQPVEHTVSHTSTESHQPERGNLRRSATTGARTMHRKRASYDITQNGSLQLGGGYEIGRDGVVNVPFATRASTQHIQLYAPEPLSASSNTSVNTVSSNDMDQSIHSYTSITSSISELSSTRSISENVPSSGTPNVAMQSLPSPPRMTSAPTSTQSRHRQPSLGVPIKLHDLVKLGELGRGATGPVIKALYLPTLTIVALKSVRIDNNNERHQMLKELKAFHTVHSANILSFIGASFNDGKLTMVLEYMNRGSLDQVVKRHGALCEDTIRTVAEQTLHGLQHLHYRHTVHRDIKPANILVNSSGTCKISDFGLLKQLDNTNAMCNTFVGTLMYLSPERVTGDNFSYPSDIWSLGLALIYCAQQSLPVPKDYWALVTMFKEHQSDKIDSTNKSSNNTTHTGNDRSPFDLDPSKFSVEFCDFIRCCMCKDPLKRSTATQLLQHPFIKSPLGMCRNKHISAYAQLLDTNMIELNKLVDAVLQHYYADCIQWKQDSKDIARIKHIAEQLGCAELVVGNAFRDKFNAQLINAEAPLVTLAQNYHSDMSSSSDDELMDSCIDSEISDVFNSCDDIELKPIDAILTAIQLSER